MSIALYVHYGAASTFCSAQPPGTPIEGVAAETSETALNQGFADSAGEGGYGRETGGAESEMARIPDAGSQVARAPRFVLVELPFEPDQLRAACLTGKRQGRTRSYSAIASARTGIGLGDNPPEYYPPPDHRTTQQ